jgi:hypothetical protein
LQLLLHPDYLKQLVRTVFLIYFSTSFLCLGTQLGTFDRSLEIVNNNDNDNVIETNLKMVSVFDIDKDVLQEDQEMGLQLTVN